MGKSLHAVITLLVLASGCVPPASTSPRGMRFADVRAHERDTSLVELARAAPSAHERPLLVMFPRNACSSTASAVLVDARGRFLGAVAPGTAALLTVPRGLSTVTFFSSVEVTAPVGAWHDAKDVLLPAPPGGLVVRSARWSARDCGSGAYFDVQVATKEEIETELGEAEIRWLDADRTDGQAWLDAHRRRVDELLSTPASGSAPDDVTGIVLR
jgi:hypothetical protein